MARRRPAPPPATPRPTPPAPDNLRERILADFAVLRVPLAADHLDAALTKPPRTADRKSVVRERVCLGV